MRGRTGGPDTIKGVWLEALAIFRRYPLATLLLVIPGVWLYAHWSLTTPLIREDSIGPIRAMRRSNTLVRGNFWFVFMTATIAYFLEGVIIHLGGGGTRLATGSHTWGEWGGGSIVAALVLPLAAFATSLAHASVARREECVGEVSRAATSGNPAGKRK